MRNNDKVYEMKTILAILCITLFAGCQDSTPGQVNAESGASGNSAPMPSADNTDAYFRFAIDGKAMQIAIDDISTPLRYDGSFQVFAGADRQMSVVLTVPNVAQCPCVVPAGSTDTSSPISQGSVSLQHFPKPGNGLNNRYSGLGGTPPARAVEITKIDRHADRSVWVTGLFSTTVLKTQSNGDGPENRDYVISDGQFRLHVAASNSAAFESDTGAK